MDRHSNNRDTDAREWALILGASSGFGATVSVDLARNGMNIAGVHLDRRQTMPNVERIVEEIRAMGREARFYNVNAADPGKRTAVLDDLARVFREADRPQMLRCVLHSLAFGSLKPFIAEHPGDTITTAQMDMTLDVMAHSLVYWTQDLYWHKLLSRGTKIFAMTSSGSHRAIPLYGAVSAAKAALEAHVRQLAVELGPHGVLVNAIQAGVTDTPALRKIPGNEVLIDFAVRRNPGGRPTTPQDIAATIATLCRPEVQWVTGDVIRVDGGEDIIAV
ncbi:MAG: SDR family oxidoreductase [Chloroflexi bacterium]|nr:SDR family oxidoreductase [Chloroflexota bacterium]